MEYRYNCKVCGTSIIINKDAYRRRILAGIDPAHCTSCFRSIKQKRFFNNMTEDQKKILSEKRRNVWINLPQDKKDIHLKRLNDVLVSYKSNLTKKERRILNKKISKGIQNHYDNMSEEERIIMNIRCTNSLNEYRANATEEQKINHYNKISRSLRKLYTKRKKQS